jgi:hypothetical protein
MKRALQYILIGVGLFLVVVVTGIAAALAFEPLREFGPTLYLINGVLIVGGMALWRLCRHAPRLGISVTACVLLGVTTFVIATSVSPAGKYVVGGCRGPGLRSFGISDEYYQLLGGVCYDIVDGHAHRTGSYYRKNGRWILRMDRVDGVLDEQELRFSVLGFDTVIPPIEGNEGGPTTFNRRRLVPFTKPTWMPEWLE